MNIGSVEGIEKREKSFEAVRPNVFSYSSSSQLLEDWVSYLQEIDKTVSLRYLGEVSGLSAGFLSYVVTGKRSLSDKAFDKLKPHLKMKQEEIVYFDVIRKVSGNYSHEVKSRAFEAAQRMRAYRDENPETTETYNYLSSWLHIAIRELAQFETFKADPKWIKRQLNFDASIKDIKMALEFLISTNLIVKNASGNYEVSLKSIGCGDEVFRLAINNYHKEMLRLAYDAQVEMAGLDNRSLRGHTLSLSKNQYDKIQKLLAELDEEIRNIETVKDGERELVTQVQIAVFNLASKKGGRK